jgi:hypothetical protein
MGYAMQLFLTSHPIILGNNLGFHTFLEAVASERECNPAM